MKDKPEPYKGTWDSNLALPEHERDRIYGQGRREGKLITGVP